LECRYNLYLYNFWLLLPLVQVTMYQWVPSIVSDTVRNIAVRRDNLLSHFFKNLEARRGNLLSHFGLCPLADISEGVLETILVGKDREGNLDVDCSL
jgi:hypothetical protein